MDTTEKLLLIITNGTLPVPAVKGGAVETLIETFLRFNEIKGDFKITVFSIFDSDAKIQAENFKNCNFIFINTNSFFYRISRIIRYSINRILGNKIKNQFISKVVKHKYVFKFADAILCENNPGYIQFLRKITNRPIGLHLHNDYINVDSTLNNFANDKLDFLITVSTYIRNRTQQIIGKKLKTFNVYNGIDLARFSNDVSTVEKNELKNKFGFISNDTIIIFSGRLKKHKGIVELIQAFKQVDNKLGAKLLIVGGEAFKDSNYNHLTKKFGIKDIPKNIIFTGFIDYSEIHKYYALAHFAVLPSLCDEAFGLTALEAMAAGLPVIITDSGGMPEVINDKCGIIVKRNKNLQTALKNEMENLIIDKELRNKMSIEAKKQAQKFSDIEYYNNMASSLKSVLE